MQMTQGQTRNWLPTLELQIGFIDERHHLDLNIKVQNYFVVSFKIFNLDSNNNVSAQEFLSNEKCYEIGEHNVEVRKSEYK